MTRNREGASWQDRPTEGTGHAGRLWVHFDADVFDADEMPAVTYGQPGGLDWGQLEALLRPPASSPALVGLPIAETSSRTTIRSATTRAASTISSPVCSSSKPELPRTPIPRTRVNRGKGRAGARMLRAPTQETALGYRCVDTPSVDG